MTNNLPLTGINVADFSWFGAGPICAEVLGELGYSAREIEALGAGEAL